MKKNIIKLFIILVFFVGVVKAETYDKESLPGENAIKEQEKDNEVANFISSVELKGTINAP